MQLAVRIRIISQPRNVADQVVCCINRVYTYIYYDVATYYGCPCPVQSSQIFGVEPSHSPFQLAYFQAVSQGISAHL